MPANNLLSGLSISPGIGYGKPFFLVKPKIVIPTDYKGLEDEIGIFQNAISQATHNLENMIKDFESSDQAAGAGVEVIKAHLEILKDPVTAQEIISLIKAGSQNAAQATETIFNKYIITFQGMEDSYFKERAIDVRDVKEQILCYMLKIQLPNLKAIKEDVVIIALELTPSDTIHLNPKFVKGVVCEQGGKTSHTGIMTRAKGIPAVSGIKDIFKVLDGKLQNIFIDGSKGVVAWDLPIKEQADWKQRMLDYQKHLAKLQLFKDKPSLTKDNHKILIEANIGLPTDVDEVNDKGAEGIGLYRSEFLYMNASHFPTEEEQLASYKAVAIQHKNIVVVRTLDIGGDKMLSYYKFDDELNPFLGNRAIRWCLKNEEVFRTQIRALLRASAFGKIAIMFPMISTVQEFKDARAIVEAEKKRLAAAKIAFDANIQVGMMIEIPSAALIAEKLAIHADFFSIGTNDLIQYSMAADRMNSQLEYLYQPLHPGVLRLIKMTADGAHAHNRWVGICGEAAADMRALPIWVGLGIDALSMSATSILGIREFLSRIDSKVAKQVAEKALSYSDEAEIIKEIDKKFTIA